MDTDQIRLTQYSHGAGCGCKIAPAVLKEILHSNLADEADRNLLVGNSSNDDAAAYDLGNGMALISTTDFFMPVVDDAYDFGRIAATNAMSDVYAMGGKPILAIAILGFPVEKLPSSIAQKIIEGARGVCKEAGITLAGGHSIDSPEPIFGLAVNGMVDIKNLKRNNTAKKGDLLFLTKPLGIGIISTAAKRGLAKPDDLQNAISSMSLLNKVGEQLGKLDGVNSLTDVTGFGLLGHLIEMAEGSNLSAEIFFDKIPVMIGLKFYLDQFIYPDMTMKNFSAFSSKTNELNAEKLFITCDPQTSGGLLAAVDPNFVDQYLQVINDFGLNGIADKQIGVMVEKGEKVVIVQ